MRYRFLRYPDGKSKAVTLSYDDGCRQDIRLSELLNKYGLKCTFNLNSNWLGKSDKDWHLTKEEIKKYIIDTGHEIAVHGAEHRANGNLRAVEGIQDVVNCRLGLEKDFDCIVRGMAYPDSGVGHFHNGITMEDISTYLKSLDIAYARALGEKNDSFNLPTDWYRWMPTAHHNSEDVFELIEKFVSYKQTDTYLARRIPKLFYLWGHSYEFDQKNNWDRMEKICLQLSNKEDIWYATNIEIFDYVSAYHSLIFSADSSRIYNPTLKTIWFEVDDIPYSIKPGETLRLS